MALSKTPLRYPGGKQRLVPFLIELLIANDLLGGDYVEPYAGGAGAALELLLTRQVSNIHLNDSSVPIYSFWKSVLYETDAFCAKISSASLTVEEWRRQRQIIKTPDLHSDLEVGFSTFYLNRVNRSGVISGGLIGGIQQEGEWKMGARFSRSELIRRVEAIAYRSKSIHISNMDAEIYINKYIPTTPKNTFIYFDPPYFEKSGGLYLDDYLKKDHERLAKTIQNKISRKWILSYDGANEIINYYSKRRYFLYDLQYNAAKVYKGKEVFIFCDSLKLPTMSSLPFIEPSLKKLNDRLKKNMA